MTLQTMWLIPEELFALDQNPSLFSLEMSMQDNQALKLCRDNYKQINPSEERI